MAKSEKSFLGGSGPVSSNGINELELGAREIWLRIRKKQQARRKSACRHSAIRQDIASGNCKCQPQEKVGHTGWRNRQRPGLCRPFTPCES